MANESYEDFAKQLQKEIEQEEGIKFGIVEKHLFANITSITEDGNAEYLGVEVSETIWDHLKAKGYIDLKGKVQDALKTDLKNNTVDLPESVQEQAQQILNVLKKVSGKLNIKNADDRKEVKLNKAVYLGEEFKALWDRIKYKTTFRVDFNCEALTAQCADEIAKTLVVGKARFIYRKSKAVIDRGGVQMEDPTQSTHLYESRDFQLPDLISYLQNETNLTRKTLVEIIQRSGRLQDFKNNPQKFIEGVANIIKRQMRLFIVDGIKYEKIGDEHYYAQELFEENELYGYLSKNMLESEKSIYDHVVYDSDVEQEFARSFELSDDIKVYAKLPGWFKIDTPLGGYNPDWAVLVEIDGQQRLYFVVETKGNLFSDTLRPTEQAKIDCGKEHFKALGSDISFAVASDYQRFTEKIV
jgi:type III restriction enzyme